MKETPDEREEAPDKSVADDAGAEKNDHLTNDMLHDLTSWLESVEKQEEEDLFESLQDDEEELRNADPAQVEIEAKFLDVIEKSRRRIASSAATGADHLLQFDQHAEERKLKISSLPKEQVQERLGLLRAKQLNDSEKIRKHFYEQQEDIANRERAARDRIVKIHKTRSEELVAAKKQLGSRIVGLESRFRRIFKRQEDYIRASIDQHDAQVREEFGVLNSDLSYTARRLVVDTSERLPQKVVIHFDLLRGVKDKLARGTYAIGVYLLDELGGARLSFEKAKGQQSGFRDSLIPLYTRRFHHSGRFSAFEVIVDESVILLCPSSKQASKSNVYILEIYELLGEASDVVQSTIGWAALPVLNAAKKMNEGKFKIPFLKGPYTAQYDRFFKIEESYACNLDKWLCNAYLRTKRVAADSSVPNMLTIEANLLHSSLQMDFVRELKNARKHLSPIKGSRFRRFFSRNSKVVPTHNTSSMRDISLGGAKPEETLDAEDDPFLNDDEPLPATDEDRLEYGYSVFKHANSEQSTVLDQLGYLWYEVSQTLRLSRWRTNESLLLLVFLVAAFYVRMIAHYAGQYAYLRFGNYATVFDFQVLPHKCIVKFSDVNIPLFHLINLVFVGTGACLLVFAAASLICILGHKAFGYVPGALTRALLLFGIMTVFDPFLVLLVDYASGQVPCNMSCSQGKNAGSCLCSDTDAWRVIKFFQESESSVFNGVYLLLFVYAITTVFSAIAVATFIVFVHRDGRAHDLYRRLHAIEDDFFLPQDNEVTPRYVSSVKFKAKHWKGPRGAFREVIDGDEDVKIYEALPRGLRTLWRAFSRLETGEIVEHFGG